MRTCTPEVHTKAYRLQHSHPQTRQQAVFENLLSVQRQRRNEGKVKQRDSEDNEKRKNYSAVTHPQKQKPACVNLSYST